MVSNYSPFAWRSKKYVYDRTFSARVQQEANKNINNILAEDINYKKHLSQNPATSPNINPSLSQMKQGKHEN